MTRRLGLIVTDASPLITLAVADALDCLLKPGLPVLVPDMVYAEVTRDLSRLGATSVVGWVRDRHEAVRIVPTEVFAEFQSLLSVNPRTRSGGRGEQAALEVLGHEIANDAELEAVLLFEDKDVESRAFVRALPPRVSAVSTGDFLRELEAAGLIQSADHILDLAAEAGRNVDRLRAAGETGGPMRSALRDDG